MTLLPQRATKGTNDFRKHICALCAFLWLISPVQAQSRNDVVSRLENVATLIRDDRLAEAERQLNSILRTNSNQADALNLLGAIRAKQRRFNEAESFFARAVGANAALVSARMNLVQLYSIQGKAQNAISELNHACSLECGDLCKPVVSSANASG